MNEQLVMGLRPTAMRASTEGAPNSDRTIRIVVEVDENLGAETYIHSTLEIPPVITPDVEELLADSGRTTETLGDTTQFVARISSDVPITKGEGLDLLVDTTKLHFFDPESGERIGLRAEAATA
jgi:multiple sugar transport system ATP-binding protein